jgi:serine/threonine protein kinase
MPLGEGDTFAGFAIVRRLGSGAMGDVYLVQHPRLPRMQALRILPAGLSADPGFRGRFQRDADLVASLSHPNIAGVHDRGETDGHLWILMGYFDGIDAERLVRERYPRGMPREQALQIVGDVAAALDHAHERGLEHRNVRPANILITDPGTAHSRTVLADLGIARMPGGTDVDYTAPEQLLNQPYQGRADQYSLAATAYFLLSGSAPFADPSRDVVINRQLGAPPPRLGDTRPELADLDAALSRALAKDPGQRYPRCHDLVDAMRGARLPDFVSGPVAAAVTGPWVVPTPPAGPPAQSWPSAHVPQPFWPPPPPPARRRDRRWWIVGAAAVAMVAVIVAAVVLTQGGTRSSGTSSKSGGASSSAPSATAGYASAGDTGPVAMITEDPTCTTWAVVSQTYLLTAPIEHWDSNHLGQENPLKKPGTAWTPEERSELDATGAANRVAATKAEPLAKTTPHRAMRELYEQFIVYGRAFADALGDKYLPRDNGLGAVAESALNALVSICSDITSGAAKARTRLVSPADAPPHPAAPQDPAKLQRFAGDADISQCGQVTSIVQKYNQNPAVKDWTKNNELHSASLWTDQQKATADAVTPLMSGVADDLQAAGRNGNNAVIDDFATLSALYQRAVVKTMPMYLASDGELYGAAEYLRAVLRDACVSIGA